MDILDFISLVTSIKCPKWYRQAVAGNRDIEVRTPETASADTHYRGSFLFFVLPNRAKIVHIGR